MREKREHADCRLPIADPLASADARVGPRIAPRFLPALYDSDTLLARVRIAQRIMAAPSLAEQGDRTSYVPPHVAQAPSSVPPALSVRV